MLAAAAALFLVPAALTFASVARAIGRHEGTLPGSAYPLATLCPMLVVWLITAILAIRADTGCTPHCDGMTAGLLIVGGLLGSILSGLGGFAGCLLAIEWDNRRT
jgi:hypothetical protein